jgi:hypothetical protein
MAFPIAMGTRRARAGRTPMNRRELLQRMDERIARTEGRIERLSRWLQWTAYRESVELARHAAIESLNAWRALRITILETWRLVRHRARDGERTDPPR